MNRIETGEMRVMTETGIDRGIKVTNDLTRRKEPFVPLSGNRVTMYVCGVTVYDECHIGHARAYICFDVIRRYLEYRGYEVFHIQNFTDVDDKIIARANEEGIGFDALAGRNIKSYFEVMDTLGIERASIYPRATEYIGGMIDMIGKLVDGGYAYAAGGDVFFDVSSFRNYGAMSNVDSSKKRLTDEDAEMGKRNPEDFALWKSAKEGEPAWESPWGGGRPGWHIECSAMATALAGPTLDIHGGGHDLIFPHHENEIAQSEACTGKQFVRYWLHNGFVEMDREKMSKSLGNVVSVREILKRFGPGALRMFFLGAHYKMPVTYSEERLDEAAKALARFETFFARIADLKRRETNEAAGGAALEYRESVKKAADAFAAAMDDDFNTPAAAAELFTLARNGNTLIAGIESRSGAAAGDVEILEEAREKILELGGILGLFGERTGGGKGEVKGLVELLLSIRNEARARKDFAMSDRIRDELSNLGFVIEDGPSGTTWRGKQ
jgi:cysteinyl-tRNA synthetase